MAPVNGTYIGGSIMLWRGFSLAETRRLVRMNGKMNWAKCRIILEENISGASEDLKMRFILQQKNDQKYTTRATIKGGVCDFFLKYFLR